MDAAQGAQSRHTGQGAHGGYGVALPYQHRPEGWEARLAEVLKEATVRSFHLGTWDCARFAHACAEAVTARELPFTLRRTLPRSVDAIFERYPDPRQAQRGDVVLAHVPRETLGVCVGPTAVFLSAEGLLSRPLAAIAIAWRVI